MKKYIKPTIVLAETNYHDIMVPFSNKKSDYDDQYSKESFVFEDEEEDEEEDYFKVF